MLVFMDILGWLIVIGVCGFLIWVIYTLVIYIWLPGKEEKQLVVVVQNAEKNIEGILREIILWQRHLGKGTRLLIVDINSHDKTVEIIERLAYPQNCISLISLDNESQLGQVLEKYRSQDDVVIRQYS